MEVIQNVFACLDLMHFYSRHKLSCFRLIIPNQTYFQNCNERHGFFWMHSSKEV